MYEYKYVRKKLVQKDKHHGKPLIIVIIHKRVCVRKINRTSTWSTVSASSVLTKLQKFFSAFMCKIYVKQILTRRRITFLFIRMYVSVCFAHKNFSTLALQIVDFLPFSILFLFFVINFPLPTRPHNNNNKNGNIKSSERKTSAKNLWKPPWKLTWLFVWFLYAFLFLQLSILNF